MRRLIYILTGLAVAALTGVTPGCQGPEAPVFEDPPWWPGPGYVPPSTTITSGPNDGEIIERADVTATWVGSDSVTEYRYRMDGVDWSQWQSNTSADYPLLDEGEHVFQVMGRYPTEGEQPQPTTRTFTVDAVKGPALMFRPRRVVVEPGDTFSVDVVAEEVEDLMGARVAIAYDATALRLQEIEEGEFLAKNGGSVVFLDEQGGGSLTFDTAVAEGTPAGVTGTGAVATLTFRAQREGEMTLTYVDESVLRDSTNQDIPLSDRVDGVVVVREETP